MILKKAAIIIAVFFTQNDLFAENFKNLIFESDCLNTSFSDRNDLSYSLKLQKVQTDYFFNNFELFNTCSQFISDKKINQTNNFENLVFFNKIEWFLFEKNWLKFKTGTFYSLKSLKNDNFYFVNKSDGFFYNIALQNQWQFLDFNSQLSYQENYINNKQGIVDLNSFDSIDFLKSSLKKIDENYYNLKNINLSLLKKITINRSSDLFLQTENRYYLITNNNDYYFLNFGLFSYQYKWNNLNYQLSLFIPEDKPKEILSKISYLTENRFFNFSYQYGIGEYQKLSHLLNLSFSILRLEVEYSSYFLNYFKDYQNNNKKINDYRVLLSVNLTI